jgi:hypothetical protein
MHLARRSNMRIALAATLLVGAALAANPPEQKLRVAVINRQPFHSEIVAGLMQVRRPPARLCIRGRPAAAHSPRAHYSDAACRFCHR